MKTTLPIVKVCNSRAALAGNPSDGFSGKVFALPLRNFGATVVLSAADRYYFQESPMIAQTFADSISDVIHQGVGGLGSLIQATNIIFQQMLEQKLKKPVKRSFAVHVDTTIPRQRGMAGSSAVIIAYLKALLKLHHLEFELSELAHWALKVETDILGIAAGPQDRVVQCFDAPVLMDFSPAAYGKNSGKFGNYQSLPTNKMPQMALLISNEPSHSGKVHSPVKKRFLAGDKKIIKLMKQIAELAPPAAKAFAIGDYKKLGECMQNNAKLRVKIYGEEVLGDANMRMLSISEKAGCPMNFTGSGGAAIVLLPERLMSLKKLRQVITEKPYKGSFSVIEAQLD